MAKAGLVAVAAGLVLAACVSDQQAVDMGLATRCDGATTFSRLGDAEGRYLRGDRTEQCKGARRDAGNRRQIVLADCATGQALTMTVSQAMANPARHGPDYDLSAPAETQLLRLKLGLADFAAVQQGLTTAGVPYTVAQGTLGEQCRQVAGPLGATG